MDVLAAGLGSLQAVRQELFDAAVFVDGPNAEVIKFNYGVGHMLELGALSVFDFECDTDRLPSMLEALTSEPPRAVFLLSCFLDEARERIESIVSCVQFAHCTVLCWRSPSEHLNRSSTPHEPYRHFCDAVEEHMATRDARPACHVCHFDVQFVAVSDGFLVLPSLYDLYPLGLQNTASRVRGRVAKGAVPDHLKVGVASISYALNSLTRLLDLAPDIHTMGTSARLVGDNLQSLAENNKSERSVALLIVDRDLDLVTPSVHGDCFMDHMFNTLPRAGTCSTHSPNVSIAVDALLSFEEKSAGVNTTSNEGFATESSVLDSLVVGGVGHPNDARARRLMSTLMKAGKTKEAMAAAQRAVVEVLAAGGCAPESRKAGRVSVSNLRQFLLDACTSSAGGWQHQPATLEIVAAVVQTLECSEHDNWSELQSLEKILQLNAADPSQSLYAQLSDTVASQVAVVDATISVRDVLMTAMMCTCLAGRTRPPDYDEEKLVHLICTAVLDFPQASPVGFLGTFDDKLAEEARRRSAGDVISVPQGKLVPPRTADERDDVERRIKDVFVHLHDIAAARQDLTDHRDVMALEVSGSSHTPLLEALVARAADPSRPPLNDLHHISSASLTSLFHTGFSRMLSKSKEHPADHEVLMVFVLGGVTCAEVAAVKRAAGGRWQEVLVVGSGVSSMASLYDQVFS